MLDPVGGELFATSVGILAPLGTIVGIGYAGGWWEELNPALLVGRNVGIQGFYLGRLMARSPDIVAAAAGELRELWAAGAIGRGRRRVSPRQAADAHRLIEDRKHVGKVVLDVRAALVTGSASGIGAAVAGSSRTKARQCCVLDLITGFDVSDRRHGRPSRERTSHSSTPASAATGDDLEGYRRMLGVNVDGVVLGVRRLEQTMGAGGSIVATASLAGLVPMPHDPIYTLTKHAVVGYVRAIAPAPRRAQDPHQRDLPRLRGHADRDARAARVDRERGNSVDTSRIMSRTPCSR